MTVRVAWSLRMCLSPQLRMYGVQMALAGLLWCIFSFVLMFEPFFFFFCLLFVAGARYCLDIVCLFCLFVLACACLSVALNIDPCLLFIISIYFFCANSLFLVGGDLPVGACVCEPLGFTSFRVAGSISFLVVFSCACASRRASL